MAWSKSFDSVLIIVQWSQGPRIEAGLYLSKDSAHLLKRQPCIADDALQVSLHTPDSRFPQASKVGRKFRDKVPVHILRCAEFGDFILSSAPRGIQTYPLALEQRR